MKPQLFIVERTTQKRSYVYFDRYVVLARDEEEARSIAMAHNPQDELDGPTVVWTAEVEGSTIVKCGDGIRKARR